MVSSRSDQADRPYREPLQSAQITNHNIMLQRVMLKICIFSPYKNEPSLRSDRSSI